VDINAKVFVGNVHKKAGIHFVIYNVNRFWYVITDALESVVTV
jgi:hypothetical protein